jgi:NSS family neurotransmitter:Na+ symporter
MITYAAYADTSFDLGRTGLIVIIGDTAISVLAGLAIFPLVFRYDLDPAEGASLMFLTLPIAFGQLPLGNIVGAAFFLLLFVAALASSLSLLELVVAPLIRRSGWSRRRAAFAGGLALWVAGLPTVFSFNLWRDVRPLAGIGILGEFDIFELLDALASNVMLPLGGLLIAVLVGWRLPAAMLPEEMGRRRFGRLLRALLRWAVPPLILAFVLAGLFAPS